MDKWQRVYSDLNSVSNDEEFLQNYVHSNESIFKTMLDIKSKKQSQKDVEEEFKKNIFDILLEEIKYYKTIEQSYIAQINSKRSSDDQIKNSKELLESFAQAYREAIKGTIIESQIKIKNARIENKSNYSSNGKWKPSVEQKKDFFSNIGENINAISQILYDVANNYYTILTGDYAKEGTRTRVKQNYIKVWKPIIERIFGTSGPKGLSKSTKEIAINTFLENLTADEEELLWSSLITKSGSPYGFVFQESFIDISIKEDLKDFISFNSKGSNRRKQMLYTGSTTKNVIDVIFSEVDVDGIKVKIGASLKMKADDKIQSRAEGYDMTNNDYLKKSLSISSDDSNFLLYMRKNYQWFNEKNDFTKNEINLTILFGITRFLNAFIEKIKEDKEGQKVFTMFIISRENVYLVSDILDNILNVFKKQKNLKKISGLKIYASEKNKINVREQADKLIIAKQEFLSKALKVSDKFYKVSLGDGEISRLLQNLNYELSQNPVKKAYYELDLKVFYKSI